MNALSRLSEYLGEVERRLRLLAVSRGAAIAAGTALAFTVLGVILANYFAFSPRSVLLVRLTLFLALAGAVGRGLVLPLIRLNRRHTAREVERQRPHFEQRLVTFAERVDRPDPFLELLAADTLDVTGEAGPERIAPRNRILSFCTAGVASVAGLLWLAVSGPGFLSYGTSLLWGAIPHDRLKPFYAIEVQPGNRTIRRKSDQMVTARLSGFQTGGARVFAKYLSSSKWEEAPMYRQPSSPNFEFLFTGVPESLDYRVEAAGVRSATYRLNVIDLPEVRKLRVTYHYPAWTALKDAVEDPGGDLRAVEGTEAEVKVETDRPLSNGALVLDDGAAIALRDGVGRVPLQKDGLYHVATAEHGEMVRLSNDYFIEVQKATPPTVRILRPGRDAKVNPIEEVTIAVEAQDDFGLRGIDLHYSVNGGPEKTVALGGTSRKAAQASTTLFLEDYKLVPGDVVSFSATARNALSTARSDIFFIEAQPFELAYRQSQQIGGAGGGQMPQVAGRQKEIIAATWNQIKNPSKDKAAEDENARLLAGIQSKLRDQAKSLGERMKARDWLQHAELRVFIEEMSQAVQAMEQAVPKLRAREWTQALPVEQKSLQHLSRAEAIFRDIQVAFGNGNGTGGTGRDMEGLFDLELDREKNQFETGRNAASPDQRQKEIEEALAKLEELARRQQELAEQQRQNQQAYQQRWQQEMLRREAEELQRKMEQLTRGQSSSQARQGQQGQSGQGGQSGEQSQQSQQAQQAQQAQQSAAVNRALERLTQAMHDMQNAGSAQGQGTPQREAEARRAAERLREARDMLAGLRKQQAGEDLASLAQRSQRLAEEQRNFEGQMRQAFGSLGQDLQGRPTLMPGTPRRQTEQLQNEEKELIDLLNGLEQDMQRTARDMAGSQPQASKKLRDALGEMQKQELRLKMGWSFAVMRQGMGPYALTRQPSITQGLKELSDRLREAQSALNREQPGEDAVESALARAERLREQLERLRNSAAGQQARQGQQGKQGQQAQQQGQDTGSQRSQASGQQGGESSQGTDGTPGPGGLQGGSPVWTSRGGGELTPNGLVNRNFDPAIAERTIREGFRDLGQIEQMLRNSHDIPRDVSRDISDAIRETQRINTTGLSTSPERIDQLISQLIGGVEQIELRLQRLAEEKQNGSVRSGASQPVPSGYAEAVAQYFRRLSKGK